MPKPPDYNPTVPQTNSTQAAGSGYEALVGREHVETTSGAPTTSDAFPTAGRVAVDTSTTPDTYYIGDGTNWLQAVPGGIHNPEEITLSGNVTPTASYGAENPYVLRVNTTANSGNTRELIGFDNADAQPGQELVVMGPTPNAPPDTIVIKDNNATATNAFQTTSGTDQTIDASTDLYVFKFTGTDWEQTGSGAGN